MKKTIRLAVLLLTLATCVAGFTACSKNSNDRFGIIEDAASGLTFRLDEETESYRVVGCDEWRTEVVIPSEFNGHSVTVIGNSAFKERSLLINVTIPDTITSIGSSAFSSCDSLTSVTIGSNVTSIGEGAFFGCDKLVEVVNKSSLNITKGEWDNGCVGKYALNIKTSGDREIVNKDGYLFYTYDNVNYLLGYVGSETNLTLPDSYNGESYEIYEYAFADCDTLTSITIPNSVTSIGYDAFHNCSSLISVNYTGTIDEWVQIDFTYEESNPLTYAKKLYINDELITEANITTATRINDYAFYNCDSLTSVTIGSGVKSIGEWAFCECSLLTSVTFKNLDGWHTYLDGKDVDLDLTDIVRNAICLKKFYGIWYKA